MAILAENGEQLSFVEHQNVIEALAAHTAQKSFADGIRSWDRAGVLSTRTPTPLAARSKSGPYLSSRSRMMNRGADAEGRCVAYLLGGPPSPLG